MPIPTFREQLEHAKKEAEQKARKEEAEKEELQALLKEREEEMEAELAARDEAVSDTVVTPGLTNTVVISSL